MDELGAWGYDVVRSAASKGAADLVAVHDDEILFVQVKLGKDEQDARFVVPSPAERRELIRIARRCKGMPIAVTRFPGRGSIPPRSVYRLLVGEAPDAWLMWTCRQGVDDMSTREVGDIVARIHTHALAEQP